MADQTADIAIQVRNLFDAKAASWPSKYAPDGRLAGRLTRLTDAVTDQLPTGGNVLDLGCGSGELASAIAAAGMLVSGCDISPEMLSRAKAADPSSRVDWVQLEHNWRRLPFEPETFDAVVASSVLEYVDDPVAVLRECCRMLRPGGVMLCTVPNPRHPVRWLEGLLCVVARLPGVQLASRGAPRLAGYLTYLRVSRQRHSITWWRATALLSGLLDVPCPGGSPLRLLISCRPDRGGGVS